MLVIVDHLQVAFIEHEQMETKCVPIKLKWPTTFNLPTNECYSWCSTTGSNWKSSSHLSRIIDKMVLKNCKIRKTKLNVVWIDLSTKRHFNSMPRDVDANIRRWVQISIAQWNSQLLVNFTISVWLGEINIKNKSYYVTKIFARLSYPFYIDDLKVYGKTSSEI